MGVRILEGNRQGDSDGAVLYCSVVMKAFGPVFEDGDQAQRFLDWLGAVDPRILSDNEMGNRYAEFLAHEQEEERA